MENLHDQKNKANKLYQEKKYDLAIIQYKEVY